MADVVIYTKATCPYCQRAKALLMQKGQQFTEIPVDNDPVARQTMEKRSGGHTVPQIFINGASVGGCDELYALELQGELAQLLTQQRKDT